MTKIRVWDLPTRLFHWSLVLLLVGAVSTAHVGGAAMVWHFRIGYALSTLLLFRLAWGLVGSRYARFAAFLAGPAAIAAYLRQPRQLGRAAHGHSPLGGLSVLAMLLVLLAQVLTGMLGNDDIMNQGPLSQFVSKPVSDGLSWYHSEIGIRLLYGLCGLHVLAIAYHYLRHRNDLLSPMLSGDQPGHAESVAASDSGRLRLMALLLLLLCAGAVAATITWLNGL